MALPATDDVHGLDGDRWVFEGKDQGRHHVIERWSPEYNRRLPALATLGLYLMILARVPNDLRMVFHLSRVWALVHRS